MVVNRGPDLKQKFFTRTGEKSSSLAETYLAGLTKQAEGARSPPDIQHGRSTRSAGMIAIRPAGRRSPSACIGRAAAA